LGTALPSSPGAARQLREMQREDWVRAADPGQITENARQCREAMGSDFFAPRR